VPTAFRPSGADFELAFCMATRKPDGTATTGIERKSVSSSFIFEDQYYTSGFTVWDPTKYLNIWVGRFTDNTLLVLLICLQLLALHGQIVMDFVLVINFWKYRNCFSSLQ
jgi:ADP-ribosylglycohydrolase